LRKSSGQEAKLCFMGHALMESRNGLVVDACLNRADGHAERIAALAMIEPRADRPQPITLSAGGSRWRWRPPISSAWRSSWQCQRDRQARNPPATARHGDQAPDGQIIRLRAGLFLILLVDDGRRKQERSSGLRPGQIG
jgi:hypothetical protein